MISGLRDSKGNTMDGQILYRESGTKGWKTTRVVGGVFTAPLRPGALYDLLYMEQGRAAWSVSGIEGPAPEPYIDTLGRYCYIELPND